MDNDYDSIVLATIDEIKARAKVGKKIILRKIK
jgi:hypothetical protein